MDPWNHARSKQQLGEVRWRLRFEFFSAFVLIPTRVPFAALRTTGWRPGLDSLLYALAKVFSFSALQRCSRRGCRREGETNLAGDSGNGCMYLVSEEQNSWLLWILSGRETGEINRSWAKASECPPVGSKEKTAVETSRIHSWFPQ